MKKFALAAATMALIASGGAWGETHETLKAHTLSTSVGNISFGAWGRSTFEIGHQSTSTKITADTTTTGNTAVSVGTPAISAYESESNLATYGVSKVTLKADGSNVEAYATSVATYTATKLGVAAQAGDASALATVTALCQQYGTTDSPAAIQAYGADVGKATAGTVIAQMLKAQEKDVSESKNYANLNPDWSYGARVGFWIIGRTPDEHFGFDLNLDADARALFVHKAADSSEDASNVNYNEDGKYAVAIGDQAKIWGLFDIDPAMLQTKVAFGRMREQDLRGSIGDFGQRESSNVKSEDDIFSEIWTATGLFASAKGQKDTALEGLILQGAVDFTGAGDANETLPLYTAMRMSQVGVGYTIPGIAQIKAQYWGDSIDESNYRYEESKYETARAAGFGLNDYYGRMEFGVDILTFMGGANGLGDVDLEKTPNANLIELGFKLPLVTDNDLRDYDPETFYNWYSCIGTIGVIQKGFIMYKGHIWGGQGTSNLSQYSYGFVDMAKGDGANILMAGVDALAEVCANPFGKQDVFVGLSAAYNITNASADGNMKSGLSVSDLSLQQHNIAAEVYLKKTFAANNYMFTGVAGEWTIQSMKGCVNDIVDLEYTGKSSKFYMPIGVEMFF